MQLFSFQMATKIEFTFKIFLFNYIQLNSVDISGNFRHI